MSARTSSDAAAVVRSASSAPLWKPWRAAARWEQLRALLPFVNRRTVRSGAEPWLRDRLHRRAYRHLSVEQMLATRRTETVFVFGSGRSIAEVDPDEWSRIRAYDTVAFSEFQRQRFVPIRYHIVGEVYDIDEYARLFRENPFYADTIYVLQKGLLAEQSNSLVGRRLLTEGASVFRYRRTMRGVYAPPSRSFEDGIVHGLNSAHTATNFALLLGWRRIVLAGVDLYNREYFWLEQGRARPNEDGGDEAAAMEFRAATSIVEMFSRWRSLLELEGVELLTYNPRSRLAEALEVFTWGDA